MIGLYSHGRFLSAQRSHCGCCSLHFFFYNLCQKLGLVPKSRNITFSLLSYNVSFLFLWAGILTHQYKQPFIKQRFLLVLTTLSKILFFSPPRDLRLGAFGGAFREYMSILRWDKCCQEHYVFYIFLQQSASTVRRRP